MALGTSTFIERLDRFGRDRRGGMAMLFAGTLTAAMLATGVAIDFGQATRVRGQMTTALDSASLAAAREMSAGEKDIDRIVAIARQQYAANFSAARSQAIETVSFSVVPDTAASTVAVTASSRLPTAFMGIAGIETIDVGATSVAAIDGSTIEISMMLDLTGSMGDHPGRNWSVGRPKVRDLEVAAKALVDTLLPAGTNANGKVRIGLAPFSEGVNPGRFLTDVTGVRNPATSCVVERTGAEAATDAAPRFYAGPVAAMPLAPVDRMGRAFHCLSKTVQPLTDDRDTLLRGLSNLPVGGYTAGHIGTAWARYLLSPKWSGIWPTASAPTGYGGAMTKKIAILMTDGQYNTFYDIDPGRRSYTDAVRQQAKRSASAAVALCTSMKNDGITVYTVGFDLTGPEGADAKQTLQACASYVDGRLAFFDAKDGEDLLAAYLEIARQILNLRLSS